MQDIPPQQFHSLQLFSVQVIPCSFHEFSNTQKSPVYKPLQSLLQSMSTFIQNVFLAMISLSVSYTKNNFVFQTAVTPNAPIILHWKSGEKTMAINLLCATRDSAAFYHISPTLSFYQVEESTPTQASICFSKSVLGLPSRAFTFNQPWLQVLLSSYYEFWA